MELEGPLACLSLFSVYLVDKGQVPQSGTGPLTTLGLPNNSTHLFTHCYTGTINKQISHGKLGFNEQYLLHA